MNATLSVLSANTQAILLLTAPLLAARTEVSAELLTPGEYKRLARALHQQGREPADLLTSQLDEILCDVAAVIEADRLRRLLARGFALSQAIDHWQARSIWVLSRADADYPQRLRDCLKDDRPAILYGCGDRSLLERGGLAVVGSRNVDAALIDYTQAVGRLAATAGRTLVSGGARGIDQAAMRGAFDAGGKVCGVLADSLEKAVLNRDHRSLLADGQLVLISPYDPGAGFNVGNAMQRNKLIYAFADAALVVSSDLNKGGTWAGAVEQLDKWKRVPVFVRTTGVPSQGLEALQRKGALPWPEPADNVGLDALLTMKLPAELPVLPDAPPAPSQNLLFDPPPVGLPPSGSGYAVTRAVSPAPTFVAEPAVASGGVGAEQSPADELFAAVGRVIGKILVTPRKDSEIAAELHVTPAQARDWLGRLVERGRVEKAVKKGWYQLPGGLI